MDTHVLIAQSTLSDSIVEDISDGANAWTSWSIGLVTAALGFLLLSALAKYVVSRF